MVCILFCFEFPRIFTNMKRKYGGLTGTIHAAYGAGRGVLSRVRRPVVRRRPRAKSGPKVVTGWQVKSSNSHTGTKTKKKKRGWGGMPASNASKSFYTKRYKGFGLGKWKKLLAPRYIRSVTSGRLLSVAGQQTVAGVPAFYSGSAKRYALLTYWDTQMMWNNLELDEPLPGLNAPTSIIDRRLYLDHIKCVYRFKSACNMDQTITIYNVVNRRDVQDSTSVHNPVADWTQGLANQVPSGVTAPAQSLIPPLSFPGETPFRSSLFTQNFKIAKVTKFVMGAGQEHDHTIRLRVKRAFNREFTNGYAEYAHLSHWVIVVCEGPIVQSAATSTEVSIGAGEVSYVVETEWKFQAVAINRTVMTRYSDLPVLLLPTGILEDTDMRAVDDVL